MIPEKTVIEIAEALLAKTRADQVEWSGPRPRDQAYYYDFPSSKVCILFHRPEGYCQMLLMAS